MRRIQNNFVRQKENNSLGHLGFARPGKFNFAGFNFPVLSFLLAVLFVFVEGSEAANITAASASRSDVGIAVAAAVDGDTVVIPAGTAAWTTTLSITKAITLQGAGIGQTIIKDSISGSGTIISINAVAGKNTRLTGIEFENGNRAGALWDGSIQMNGINTDRGTIRVDHCKLDRLLNFSVVVNGAIGVIDHCEFLFDSGRIGIYVFHNNWDGKSYGDGSWAAPTDWNGTNWLVVEDCTFNNTSTHYAIIDSYRGARWMFRHNSVTNGWLEAHGTESGQRFRGTRAIQVYNNKFHNAIGGYDKLVNLRSGTATVCSNTASGMFNQTMTMAAYRSHCPFVPWGGADGTNGWDLNATGGPFATGTHTGANGATTLVDASKSWSLNQWAGAGYSIQNTTKGHGRFGRIFGNTANQITYSDYGGFTVDGVPKLTWNNGDTYKIYRVIRSLDQAGVGQSDLISGDTPGPVRWPNQQDEPVYAWANSPNGVFPQPAYIRQGEHYVEGSARPNWSPMKYPHPLTTVGAQTLGSPSNLRIIP